MVRYGNKKGPHLRGPFLHNFIDCPRGEADLLTSPEANDASIRIFANAVKPHQKHAFGSQTGNL